MMQRTGRLVLTAVVVSGMLGLTSCSWSNKAKGAVIGTAGGAAAGAVVGDYVGEAATGAIVGAAVGGTAGAIIGHQMDQQAKQLSDELENATVSRVGEGIVVTFDSGILFDFDSSELRDEARRNLEELASSVEDYPRTNVLVIGHTDATGSDAYNQDLSERRAQSAASYVAGQGVTEDRLSTRGMGEDDPVATNETEEGRQLNRRVEIVIYAGEEWREEVQAEN
ncbi:MAG: OmpA family protein [Longimicrobiales bacterium]